MANISSNWQDYLNPSLVDRLNRPLRQPGMVKKGMSQGIVNRCDRFLNRLPLLNQQMQRWGNNITFSSDDVPIVYAQPVSLAEEGRIEGRDQNFQPSVSQSKSSVPPIQRKVDSSQAQIQNSEFSPPSPPSLGGTRFQIPPELKSDPGKLQAKFSDLQVTSANPSQINPNPRSLSPTDEVTTINQNSPSSTEMLLVSPSIISEELAPRVQNLSQEIPIVTVQPLISLNNLNTPNYQNQFSNISRSQINQNNSHQNINILPVVPVVSQVNSSSQTQSRSLPLSLANNTPVANNISQKPNQANQNSLGSNTAAASSPKIFASSSPPTQTFVSTMETQPKIDLDAITKKVSRKIMRDLVIERERRGKIR